MSCLYILEINPLSAVSFANIFSHSEGRPSFCLWFPFAVQKFLSLNRQSFEWTWRLPYRVKSEREKQILYINTYMESFKKWYDYLVCKAEIETHM